ncbi:MAG TPA: ElyC/SanA/YdcF family protein [Solirubrobacter sp.]|nr:ElyC/SanA/YdcF family protein [Solirubrobacter sp.]
MLAPAPLVLADEARVGALAAELVRNRLLARPAARLGLEPGRAPAEMFAALRAHASADPRLGASASVIQLVTGTDDLRTELRGITFAALHTIDDAAADLDAEAARHAAVVERAPLDLAVVGLDEDGGVAFDAPPALHAGGVRVVTGPGGEPALTVGLGTLYRARELIVIAIGQATAPALRTMLEAPPGSSTPASLLTDHPRLTVIADRAAASLLTPRPIYASDQVLVVLGHREPGISPEHRISFESRARLRHARRLARRQPFRAAILTGYTSTGGLSEAEQMNGAWDEHAAPALLEVAGRNTAENASRTLPIVLALGEVRRVVVVTSAWHVRAPWFFAPYRRFGLDVSYRVSFAHGHWARMLAQELHGLRYARAQRAAAMRAAP